MSGAAIAETTITPVKGTKCPLFETSPTCPLIPNGNNCPFGHGIMSNNDDCHGCRENIKNIFRANNVEIHLHSKSDNSNNNHVCNGIPSPQLCKLCPKLIRLLEEIPTLIGVF